MKKLLLALFILFYSSLAWASSVTFEWDHEDGVTGYRFYQSQVSGSYLDPPVETIPAGTKTVTIEVAEGRWYWVVTAYDSENRESDHSNEVTAQIGPEVPDTTPPDAPYNLVVTVVSGGYDSLIHSTFEEGDDGWIGDTWDTQTLYVRDDAIAYAGQYSMRVFATGSSSYLTIGINPVDWNLDQYPYIQFAYKIPNGVPVGLFFYTTEGWVCLGGTSTHSHDWYAANDAYTLIDDDAWHVITINAKDTIREVYPTVNSVSEFEWFTFGAQEGDEFWFDEFMIF